MTGISHLFTPLTGMFIPLQQAKYIRFNSYIWTSEQKESKDD